MEVRDGDTLFVMTQDKGEEIAQKLIDRKQLKDSVSTLVLYVHYTDSLIDAKQRQISFLTADLDLADQSIVIKDKQIANHVKIEQQLNKQIKRERRKRIFHTIVGTASGVAVGIIIGVLIK